MNTEEWYKWNLQQCNPAIGKAILRQNTRGQKSYADLKTNYKFKNAPESITTMEKNIGTFMYKPETINVLNENHKSFGITKNILLETEQPLLNNEAKEAFEAKSRGALDSMITHGEVRQIWMDRINFYRSIGRRDMVMKMTTALEGINAGVRGRPTTQNELKKRAMIVEMLMDDPDMGGMSADDIYKLALDNRKDRLDKLEGNDKYAVQLSIEKKKLIEQMRIRQIDRESDPDKIRAEMERLAREKADVINAQRQHNIDIYDDIQQQVVDDEEDSDKVAREQKEFEDEEKALYEADQQFIATTREETELEMRFEGMIPWTAGHVNLGGGDVSEMLEHQNEIRKRFGDYDQKNIKEYVDRRNLDDWGRPMVYTTYDGKIVHRKRMNNPDWLNLFNMGDKTPYEMYGYDEDPLKTHRASLKAQEDFEGEAESGISMDDADDAEIDDDPFSNTRRTYALGGEDDEINRSNEGRRLAEKAHDKLTSEREHVSNPFDPDTNPYARSNYDNDFTNANERRRWERDQKFKSKTSSGLNKDIVGGLP